MRSLRSDGVPIQVRYEKGMLIVVYEDGKVTSIRSTTYRRSASTYTIRTLAQVQEKETFNFDGVDNVSFRNGQACDGMTYMEMRPWVRKAEGCRRARKCDKKI